MESLDDKKKFLIETLLKKVKILIVYGDYKNGLLLTDISDHYRSPDHKDYLTWERTIENLNILKSNEFELILKELINDYFDTYDISGSCLCAYYEPIHSLINNHHWLYKAFEKYKDLYFETNPLK